MFGKVEIGSVLWSLPRMGSISWVLVEAYRHLWGSPPREGFENLVALGVSRPAFLWIPLRIGFKFYWCILRRGPKTIWGNYIYIYIVLLRQTVSLYHSPSVWLETRFTSSWDRNPTDFTPVGYLTANLTQMYYFPLFTYALNGYRNAQFIRRALLYASGNS